jgi:hypothetical protein
MHRVVILIACVFPSMALHGASLDYLVAHASAVVVGTVTAGTDEPLRAAFTIDVERVLSGSVSSPTVSVIHPWVRAGIFKPPVMQAQHAHGIWFLTAGCSGGWDVLESSPSRHGIFLSLYLPVSATGPTGPFAYPPGTALLDALIYEVADGVAAAPAGSPDADRAVLLGAIGLVNASAVKQVIAACTVSGNAGLQAVALTEIVGRGLPAAIPQLVRAWPVISGGPSEPTVVSALRDSWRDPTPASIEQLASFAVTVSGGSNIRAAAVRALAAVHTKESLPFLASLLSSSDPSEQERAVYGLSSFANGCPIQNRDNSVGMGYLQCNLPSAYKTPDTTAHFAFRQGTPAQEASVISYWQAWWDDHPELH